MQKMNALTTADTVCIYENIDKKDGSMSVEVGKLPAKYVGLNRTTKDTTGFYIMEVDGEVCVYEHDRTTLYFKTGLRTEQLPADVRYELRKGKFMDSELQVYHFIESYSS